MLLTHIDIGGAGFMIFMDFLMNCINIIIYYAPAKTM